LAERIWHDSASAFFYARGREVAILRLCEAEIEERRKLAIAAIERVLAEEEQR